MSRLKIRLELKYSFIGLDDYLLSLNGIDDVKIDNNDFSVYVEYDSFVMSLKILEREILLYLDLIKIPSILAFDKYMKNCKKYTIVIKDLCCEYCLKSTIEELLMIDGINSAYTDFDYVIKNDVNIFITYDEDVVSTDIINNIHDIIN